MWTKWVVCFVIGVRGSTYQMLIETERRRREQQYHRLSTALVQVVVGIGGWRRQHEAGIHARRRDEHAIDSLWKYIDFPIKLVARNMERTSN